MLETYRPSGRFDPMGLLWIALAAVGGIAVAWVYQRLVDWIPFIYLNFLLTFGFAMAVAFGVQNALRRGKVRSRPLAAGAALGAAAVALAASYYWAWQMSISEVYEGLTSALGASADLTYEQFREEFTFGTWWDLRVESGWSVGRVGSSGDGGLEMTGVFVYAVWAIEAGIVFGISAKAAAVASVPFCESCDRWTDSRVLGPWLQVDTAEVRRAAREGDARALLAPRPSAGSEEIGTYVLHECAGCHEGGFVDVAVTRPHRDSKGKVEMKTEVVVPGLRLSSADRDALVAYAYPEPAPAA